MSAIKEKKEKNPLVSPYEARGSKKCKRYGKYKKKRKHRYGVSMKSTLESTRGLEWKRRIWYFVGKLV